MTTFRLVLNALVICGVLWTSGKLWRKGGDGNVIYRSFGVPLIITLGQIILVQNWLTVFYIPALFLMLRGFSYGVSAPPHKLCVWGVGQVTGRGDDQAWRKSAIAGNVESVELATRMLCCFFWGLASMVFIFTGGNWWRFGIYMVSVTLIGGWIGAIESDVEVSEFTMGILIALAILV